MRHAGILGPAVLLLAVFFPAFVTDYGIHNDYRIAESAGPSSLAFGHIESFHLVRVGRILNAYLFNLHWHQITSYTDLKYSRLISSVILVVSFASIAAHVSRHTKLSERSAAFLVFALFLAPPVTINAYYASLLVPGTLAIAFTAFCYIAQRPLLERALRPGSTRGQWIVWIGFTLSALVAGHFIYTPSTMIFLVLAAIALMYGTDAARERTAALAATLVYSTSCVVYFAIQKVIVFPWASRALSYGGRWTDPQYQFSVSWSVLGDRTLGFLHDALSATFRVWDVFEGCNAAWITIPVLVLLGIRRHLQSRTDPEARRHDRFVIGFFAVFFAIGIAPFLVSDLRWPGVRMLLVPTLLVALVLVGGFLDVTKIAARDGSTRRDRRILLASSLVLAALALATISIGVWESRSEVQCLEHFARDPRVDQIVLLGASDGESRLGLEFGHRIRETGPLHDFGTQVIGALAHRGGITPGRAQRLIASLGEIESSALQRLELRGSRTIVVDVASYACACVAGSACGAGEAPL